MTKPNKPYVSTQRLDPSIQGLYPSAQVYLTEDSLEAREASVDTINNNDKLKCSENNQGH